MAPVTWAPDGKRFAWMEEKAVMQYEVASRKQRQLVALGPMEEKAVKPPKSDSTDWQNRRVSERSFQWSAAGGEMLISIEGDLFLVRTETGKWEQLTATAEVEHDPKLSPDGRFVSFRRDHDLYSLEVATKKSTRLTTDGSATVWNGELDWVYPEELYLSTAHWWSPDSTHIAYLQFDVGHESIFPQVDLLSWRAFTEPERFPQFSGTPNADVRLGVVAVEGGATRWMDIGETRDHLLARVDWAPDSHAVAYQRLNRIQNRLDLGLADVRTGATRVLLTEEDSYWINVNDDFRFLSRGKQFLWGSERDGYHHLYLCAVDDKHVAQITKGDWEVTQVAGVNEETREVFFVSSARRARWSGSFTARTWMASRNSGSAVARTRTRSPWSPTTEYYMDTASSLGTPPRRTLHGSDGAQIAVYKESTPVDAEILPTEIVKLKAKDGAQLYARMIKPAGFSAEKKYPVIVMIYGGPGIQAVHDAWSGASFDQVLAQRGYLIWQLDNRGSAGRGHIWESEDLITKPARMS